MKRILPLACITCIVLLIAFGCAVNAPDTGDPDIDIKEELPETEKPGGSHNFELSIAETPSEIEGFEGIYIDFDEIDVSKGDDEEEEWITVNEDGGEVDILYLAGGGMQELALTDLEPGQYTQIRFHINRAWVIVEGEEIELKVPSNMLKFIKPFEIVEGETTQLVADFDFHESFRHVHYFRHFRFFKRLLRKFMLRPVIRMMRMHEIGMIKGQVVYPEDTDITVNAFRDGEDAIYKTTTVFYNGWFFLAYMEEGMYDLVFEAEGYFLRLDDIWIDVGDINYLGKISLLDATEINTIEVTVNFDEKIVNGAKIFVTSFPEGGSLVNDDTVNADDDRIETVFVPLDSNSVTVTLTNSGSGYDIGTYDIRAHVDIDGDGAFTTKKNIDYVSLGTVNVTGFSNTVTISEPWGTFNRFIVDNFATLPPEVRDTELMYLTVVGYGNTWGNYGYGSRSIQVIARYPSVDIWAPFGEYSFLAVIDVGGDFTGVPEVEDFIYSNDYINWITGNFPQQEISAWASP
jgi:hypothetical protein